jgi:hypothetical protein
MLWLKAKMRSLIPSIDSGHLGLRTIAALTVLSASHAVAAYAGPQFDETRRVVLPSEEAKTILQWYAPDRPWVTSDWNVTTAELDGLEVSLTKALDKAKVGNRSIRTWSFYRQYMPARWKGLRLVVVNGFYETAADAFPDKGIDPDQWKKKLMVAFGGGCMAWRAVYIVERDSFMTLHSDGLRARVLCNGPK